MFAAVKVLSEDLAKLPLRVYRRRVDVASGRVTRELATGHPVQMLLNEPNGIHDGFQLKDFIQSQAVLNGNGVAWIQRNGRAGAMALHPVPASYVGVFQAPDGSVFYQISAPPHLTDIIPTGMIPRRDVLHIMGMSEDGYWGISPIGRLRDAVGLTLAMEQHGSELFANGADPGGVLKHPARLSEEGAKRLREAWSSRYEGAGNRHKTVLLEEGMEYSKLGMSSVDAQFLEGRRFQVEDIARIFRVPPQKLMHLDRATFNNIEHLSLDYINDSLMPWLERWEAQLNLRLFSGYEREQFYVEFDVSRLARGDLKSRVDSARAGVQAGVMTINEARRLLDLDPVKDGDVRLEPLNMTPAGQDGRAPGAGQAQEADPMPAEEPADA